MNLTEQDKSILLAKLWPVEVVLDGCRLAVKEFEGKAYGGLWEPYEETERGYAQFALLMLKFPEVMFTNTRKWLNGQDATQANILDEILRLNGYDIDREQRRIT